MDFGQCVMERFTIAKSPADGSIEAVKKPELEQVRTLKIVLELAEGKNKWDFLFPRFPIHPSSRSKFWFLGQDIFTSGEFLKEL